VFNIKSTKECMSILIISNPIFHLCEMVFIKWENCNILDKNRDVLIHLLVSIKKSTFSYLSNWKEKQMEKLIRSLFVKIITIRDRLTKGRG